MQRKRQAGFTLTEIVIVMAIVGILGAIALPSYRSYVLRSNRSAARNFLSDIAAKEEGFAMQSSGHVYSTYFDSLIGQIGSTANVSTVYVDASGKVSAALNGDSVYSIALSNINAVTTSTTPDFKVTSTAVNKQTQDTNCTPMSLDYQGVKLPTPSSSGGTGDCWTR